MLEFGNNLLDANAGDVQFGHTGAEIRVTLIGADDEASGLGNREIGAGHARFGVQEIRPRVATHHFGKIVRVIVARLRLDSTRKNFGNIVPQLVDRWDDDMAGRFVIELLDTLAKVGLNYPDAPRLQVRTHVAFLSQHGFALDQGLRAARQENAIDDLIML